jgi:hypothetical protein
MLKHAALTALAIALNITMLTPAVSGPPRWMTRHEVDCDSSAHGLPGYATSCHCSFECRRQYGYTVTVPCASHDISIWRAARTLQRWHEGLCDVRVVPSEPTAACWHRCVNTAEDARR